MKMLKIINNQDGHGQVPSGKELLKLFGVLITFPVSLPIIKIVEKIKEKKQKREKDEN